MSRDGFEKVQKRPNAKASQQLLILNTQKYQGHATKSNCFYQTNIENLCLSYDNLIKKVQKTNTARE